MYKYQISLYQHLKLNRKWKEKIIASFSYQLNTFSEMVYSFFYLNINDLWKKAEGVNHNI